MAMGTVIRDRENLAELERWELRKAELRQLLVDLRCAARGSVVPGRGVGYRKLDPVIWVPADAWEGLAYHEKRWLEVEAAARSSRGATLVGRSAARKLGMWVVSTTPETIEVALASRGRSANRVRSGNFTYRCSKLTPSDFLVYEGHRVTTPIRTFIDIARYHGFIEGLVAADYLLRRGKERADIARAIEGMGRCKGIATVRRCFEHAIPLSDSAYESFARGLLIEDGFTSVQAQFQVDGYSVDLCIDGWLVIEIDGDLKYKGPDGDDARLKEIKRQKRIEAQGFRFLRFDPDFVRRYPEKFLQEVRGALAARDRLAQRFR